VVRHLSAVEKSNTVHLSGKRLRELGLDRNAVSRGLRALEAAALVSVSRMAGRSPDVTINEGGS